MFRALVTLVVIASVLAFMPSSRIVRQTQLTMNNDLQKFLGVAAIGFALSGPAFVQPVVADGAYSISSKYRARNKYGATIVDLKDAVSKGDYTAFDKKSSNAFDLFISQSNNPVSIKDKAIKSQEIALKSDIFSAAAAKDSSKLKTAYDSFIKVADLTSDYKPTEKGQSDSSGYAPTYGTSKEYIYIR